MKTFDIPNQNPEQDFSNDGLTRIAEMIKGINLRIDPFVQEVCETYNKSSGSTRSVLYIFLIINVLTSITVLNTWSNNWPKSRILRQRDIIIKDQSKLMLIVKKHQLEHFARKYKYGINKTGKINKFYNITPGFLNDSIVENINYQINTEKIREQLREDKEEKDELSKNMVDSYKTIKIPLLDNAFDLDYLGIITGVTFIILIIVVRFTLTREKKNLLIAFDSISDRYTEIVDKDLMDDLNNADNLKQVDRILLYNAVNYKRRRYHYNFLSMNEIFNMPNFDISTNNSLKTIISKIVVSHLFSVPFIIYLVVFVNDMVTIKDGINVSPFLTWLSVILSFACLNLIASICLTCNSLKRTVNELFKDFYNDKYELKKNKSIETETKSESFIEKNRKRFYWFFWIYAPFFIGLMLLDFSIFILNFLNRTVSSTSKTQTHKSTMLKHFIAYLYHLKYKLN